MSSLRTMPEQLIRMPYSGCQLLNIVSGQCTGCHEDSLEPAGKHWPLVAVKRLRNRIGSESRENEKWFNLPIEINISSSRSFIISRRYFPSWSVASNFTREHSFTSSQARMAAIRLWVSNSRAHWGAREWSLRRAAIVLIWRLSKRLPWQIQRF